jgi:hypothetical protein
MALFQSTDDLKQGRSSLTGRAASWLPVKGWFEAVSSLAGMAASEYLDLDRGRKRAGGGR